MLRIIQWLYLETTLLLVSEKYFLITQPRILRQEYTRGTFCGTICITKPMGSRGHVPPGINWRYSRTRILQSHINKDYWQKTHTNVPTGKKYVFFSEFKVWLSLWFYRAIFLINPNTAWNEIGHNEIGTRVCILLCFVLIRHRLIALFFIGTVEGLFRRQWNNPIVNMVTPGRRSWYNHNNSR